MGALRGQQCERVGCLSIPRAEGDSLVDFTAQTFRDPSGAIVIRSRLAPAAERRDLEKQMLPAIAVGLAGWQRAHSQGAGTGVESAHGIFYAPEEVNQEYQRLGIERYLRELLQLTPRGVALWLTTVTSAHPLTRRLKEIQYRVDAVRGRDSRRLFEASIEVSNSRTHTAITAHATPYVLSL